MFLTFLFGFLWAEHTLNDKICQKNVLLRSRSELFLKRSTRDMFLLQKIIIDSYIMMLKSAGSYHGVDSHSN